MQENALDYLRHGQTPFFRLPARHDVANSDVAVIGVPHERWGEAVKAVIVVREGVTVEAAEIVEYCKGRLAGYKQPRSVDFVKDLPRNPSGKVLKRELREPYWAGHTRRVS